MNKKDKEKLLADLGMLNLDIQLDDDYTDDEAMHHPKDKDKNLDFAQWSIMGDGSYIAAPKAEKKLPAGLYEFEWNNKAGEWCVMKQAINTDELYELPSPEIESIMNDIKIFWRKRETYKEYNFVHKREPWHNLDILVFVSLLFLLLFFYLILFQELVRLLQLHLNKSYNISQADNMYFSLNNY